MGRNESTDFTVEPVALVRLGHRRFALVEKESSPSAPHAIAGAVSIAYVQRLRHGWRRLGAWREIAWKSCLLEGLKESREKKKPVLLWVFIDRPTDDARC